MFAENRRNLRTPERLECKSEEGLRASKGETAAQMDAPAQILGKQQTLCMWRVNISVYILTGRRHHSRLQEMFVEDNSLEEAALRALGLW